MPTETLAALAKKLRLTAETRLLALDAPDDYVAALRQPGMVAALATAAQAGASYDAVHLFARDQTQARQALPAIRRRRGRRCPLPRRRCARAACSG